MRIEDQLAGIVSANDLADFIDMLRSDLLDNRVAWENTELSDFLEAMSAWLKDMKGVYKNQGQTPPAAPSWNFIGELLLAASIYE